MRHPDNALGQDRMDNVYFWQMASCIQLMELLCVTKMKKYITHVDGRTHCIFYTFRVYGERVYFPLNFLVCCIRVRTIFHAGPSEDDFFPPQWTFCQLLFLSFSPHLAAVAISSPIIGGSFSLIREKYCQMETFFVFREEKKNLYFFCENRTITFCSK